MSTNHRLPPEAVDLSSSSMPQTTMVNGISSSPQHNTGSFESGLRAARTSSQNTKHSPQVNSIIDPTRSPQTPHKTPHSSQPQPTMASQHHPDLTTSQDHHPLTTPLQNLNKPQSEQITDLRIQVAILSTSLQHAKKDKEALEKSLAIVIESLSRCHTALPISYPRDADTQRNVKDLEKEIEGLRRENRFLRRREKELGFRVAMKNLLGGEEGEEGGGQTEGVSMGREKGRDKGKGKEREMGGRSYEISFHNAEKKVLTPEELAGSWANPGPTPEQLAGSWANSNSSFKHGEGNFLTSKDLIGSWGNPAPKVGEAGPSGVNDSFGSGSTTVPNTPVLNATSFESSFADVGLHTLEENMESESDGFPPALSFPPSNTQTGEEEKDIDEQLLDQEAALQKFNAIPKPGVLNVGFTVEGTRRGNDYDAHPIQPTHPTYPPTFERKHSMKDYNRFGTQPPTGPRSYASAPPSQDLKIPGDLSGDQNLWTSNQERKDAVEIHLRSTSSRSRDAELKFPEFFRYGIRYLPANGDSNYLRTVMLSNLPLDTEIRDVLNRIRGGEVLSAVLLDTRSITGSMSARIVFRHEEAAESYTAYCETHPLLFTSSSSPEQQVTATNLQTPTFPLSPRYLSRLAHSQTRCLSIPSFPPSLSLITLERNLASNNGVRGAMLSELFIDESGTLHLQFSDVFWAGAAFGILTNFSLYRGLEVCFSSDPCEGPVEELALPIPPRPPMLPKNWSELQKRLMGNGEEVVTSVEEGQRKRLPALNQKIEIPSFSGTALQGGSWADEVIDELECDEPVNLPTEISSDGEGRRGIDALIEKGNGLSASRYACSLFSPTSLNAGLNTSGTRLVEEDLGGESVAGNGEHGSHETQVKKSSKSPPKVNLASPTSSSSTSSSSPRRLDTYSAYEAIREPRIPEHDLGFSSSGRMIKHYDTAEEEKDEVNLGMSDGSLIEGLVEKEVGAGVVRNEDEILLDVSDDEVGAGL